MAETKKKNSGLGLQQTAGIFQVRGIVSGTQKDNFYKDATTKNGHPFRSVSFGVEYEAGKTIFVSLNGMERDSVYFSKTEKDASGKNKTVVEKVAWRDRNTFYKDGFKLIGVNLGVKKTTDSKGNEINDNRAFAEFDACKEISENISDGQSVFVKGNIEYSTYEGRRQVRFVPNQVSLCKKAVDFESADFAPVGEFTQTIVFSNISQSEDKTKFIVAAKVIGYNAVEDAEFEVRDAKLATNFRKVLKPYTAIKVWGDIVVENSIDQVEAEADDGWGSSNKMDRVVSPYKRTLVITGADKDSIDFAEYSEDIIDGAIAKLKAAKEVQKDFGSSASWGGSLSANNEEDEDSWD